MFKLMHKNRKGVSLVELLVVLVILGLVLPLAGGVLYSLTNLNNTAVDRWDIQTAVQLACKQFETEQEGLVNAYQMDILYDPVIDKGVTISDDYSTITWKGLSADDGTTVTTSYVVPAEGSENVTSYTYLFSAPTYLSDGTYLGELLYMRAYGSTDSNLVLYNYGIGDTPVSVSFSMGTTESISGEEDRYTDENVLVNFASGREDMPPYEFSAAFTVINNKRDINYDYKGNLVFEQNWLNGSTIMAYPTGWDNSTLNAVSTSGVPKTQTVTANGSSTNAYVASYKTETKDANTGQTIISYTQVNIPESYGDSLKSSGNVLRYKSPAAESTQSSPTENRGNFNVATCLGSMVMEGSEWSDVVLDNLRNFRDNVLRGTEFGDWFIEQYYYVWSPFLVEHTEFLKPVYKAILIPLSYVCDFVADL